MQAVAIWCAYTRACAGAGIERAHSIVVLGNTGFRKGGSLAHCSKVIVLLGKHQL